MKILVHYEETRCTLQSLPAVQHTHCQQECCLSELPYQTIAISQINASKKMQGKQCRKFQKKWFSEHIWLSYCMTQNVVFCFYRKKVNSVGGLTFNKKHDDAFITRGFSNWKKGKEKLKEHECSQTHKDALMKWPSMQRPSVSVLVMSTLQRDQETRRQLFMHQLDSLRFLLRQGLAVRGHGEEGNLFQ
jgi:hypothetical protein